MDLSEEPTLIPGLPNDLAILCLSRVHPSLLSAVCRSWRHLIYSESFPPFLSLYALLHQTTTAIAATSHEENQSSLSSPNTFTFFSLDPISSKWLPLPPPPTPLHLYRHPSFLSRNFPVQCLTVSGKLVVIAATNHNFLPALSHPLVFDPLNKTWLYGPPLPTPRRWCATGGTDGVIYVASGIGPHFNADVAQSMEKWDIKEKNTTEWHWERMASLKDSKFCREAMDLVGCKGKLYVVNVKGNVAKEGVVFDISSNSWGAMPPGMVAGWVGPAASDGNEMYVVDEGTGGLQKYDLENDRWEEVMENLEDLKGAEQMVVGRGKVCVVCGNRRRIVVVDVVERPVKFWMIDSPPEMEVVAVHILPRMSP